MLIIQNVNSSLAIFLLLNCLNQLKKVNAAVHSVQLFTKFDQLVTSSTLVWESYSSNPKQLESSVQGGKYVTEDEHFSIFVCRVNIEGVYISGGTVKRMQQHLCVVSNYKEVKSYEQFEVLVNKGHLGKVSWQPWFKFNARTPVGSISVGEGSFIARHKSIRFIEDRGPDFQIGRLDTSIGLGKILVIDSDKEIEFEEGEILIETEPFRYELQNIEMDEKRTDVQINTTDLGSVTLTNRGQESSMVETVISYSYDVSQYWGVHDGVARGLQTKIFESNSMSSIEIYWGLKHSEKHFKTKQVSTHLIPGTGLNVTLRGNYSIYEAPYTAKLVAFYQGSKEIFSRNISSIVKKSFMGDLKFEFSPVFWIKNGTLIPTTTTTTTSTTEQSTIANREPEPIHPPVVFVKDIGKSASDSIAISSNSKENENPYISSDENDLKTNFKNDNPDKLAENLRQHSNNTSLRSKSILNSLNKFIVLLSSIIFIF